MFAPTIIDSDGDGIDEMFVDGGILRNMPIDPPDDAWNESNEAGVILALGLRSEKLRLFGDAKPISHLTEFISRLCECSIEQTAPTPS